MTQMLNKVLRTGTNNVEDLSKPCYKEGQKVITNVDGTIKIGKITSIPDTYEGLYDVVIDGKLYVRNQWQIESEEELIDFLQ